MGALRGRRLGGIAEPLFGLVLALVISGLVVAATGANPITAYRGIFNGSGLNWLFPWTTGADRADAASNLQQTLILTTPLILLGLAVAFAFRAGLFNIGGQGQYIIGSLAAVWAGSRMGGLPGWLHIVVSIVAAMAAGGLWGLLAGYLKARRGTNEVIATIMLNYVALWLGVYLVGVDGPLQGDQASIPTSVAVDDRAHLPVIWGDPLLQGLHIGILIALVAVVVYWVLLSRSAFGFESRALGLNREAATYIGVKRGRVQMLVMALCGALAGLAGATDVLGWQFQIGTTSIQASNVGFLGIAVALLGRATPIGVVLSALLFGSLLSGTSVRNLDPSLFSPQLGGNLTLIIQALVLLLASAPALAGRLMGARPRRRGPVGPTSTVASAGAEEGR